MTRIVAVVSAILIVKLFGLVGLAVFVAVWGLVSVIAKYIVRRREYAAYVARMATEGETQVEHDLRHMGL